jgi:hypothetical protein
MGGGMMRTDCIVCKEPVHVSTVLDKAVHKLDRRTQSYKQAHKELVQLGLTAQDAHEKLNAKE